jgi:hypothetical protein
MAVVSVVCDASETKKTLELAELVGDWSGRSRCQVKPSARHDEDVVYHLSHPHEDRITIKADKIVDGKPIPRGGGDWIYDKSSGALTWDAPSRSAEACSGGRRYGRNTGCTRIMWSFVGFIYGRSR